MTTVNELNNYLQAAWHQLAEAAKNNDWPATQQAYRKMATLQDLDQQSRNLQQRIADLSEEVANNGGSSLLRQTAFVPDGVLGSTRRGTKRPRELRIGTHREPIALNNQIVIAVANWILKQGKILPRITNFVHPTNSGFAASAQTRQL